MVDLIWIGLFVIRLSWNELDLIEWIRLKWVACNWIWTWIGSSQTNWDKQSCGDSAPKPGSFSRTNFQRLGCRHVCRWSCLCIDVADLWMLNWLSSWVSSCAVIGKSKLEDRTQTWLWRFELWQLGVIGLGKRCCRIFFFCCWKTGNKVYFMASNQLIHHVFKSN